MLTDCIEWEGARSSAGYGQKRIGGKLHYVHRLVAAEKYGDIDGKVVRHSCDNPPCCNPDHLLLGGKRENALDAVERGLLRPPMLRGEQVGTSKLTKRKAVAIRHMYNCGMKQIKIAEFFGISQSQVSNIITRRSWAHVGGQ